MPSGEEGRSGEDRQLVPHDDTDETADLDLRKVQLLESLVKTFGDLGKAAQHKEVRQAELNAEAHERAVKAQLEAHKRELPYRERESRRRILGYLGGLGLALGTIATLVVTGHENVAGWVVATITALGAPFIGPLLRKKPDKPEPPDHPEDDAS